MLLSICKEEVDNLNINYIINNLIRNADVKLDNVPRWWESKADIWVQMTISLIYYRFKVRFTKGLVFLFLQYLLQFFLAQMSSLSISNSVTYSFTFSSHNYIFIDRYNIGIFESCYASRVCIESTAVCCCHGCCPQ